jgi:hypothetical protein
VSGYSACFIRVDEKTVRTHDRLTAEAMRCLLEQTGFTEPLFVSDSVSRASTSLGSSGRGSGEAVLPFLSRDQPVEVERVRSYDQQLSTPSEGSFHQQVLKRVANYLDVNVNDFRQTHSDSDTLLIARGGEAGRGQRRPYRPLPVYTSTALQIGLLENPNVPR